MFYLCFRGGVSLALQSGMRRALFIIGLVVLSSCGKQGQESAALTSSGPACADVVACVQYCNTQFTPSVLCKSSFIGGVYSYETCQGSTCTPASNAQVCSGRQEAARAAECLNKPENLVLGS